MNATDLKDLKQSIERYGINKEELDTYKMICDTENKKIKALMTEDKLKEFGSDNYTAKLTTVDKSYTDEAKVLQVIHSFNIPNSLGIIKTKEYIDEDALESAIYNNEIPEEVIKAIADCKVEKLEYRLSVKKNK